jgi:hypothetical protein
MLFFPLHECNISTSVASSASLESSRSKRFHDVRDPDLAIADDVFTGRPAVTLAAVRVRNLSPVEGTATVSLDLLDAAGSVLLRVPLNKEAPLAVPPYQLGGNEGVLVPIVHSAELRRLLAEMPGRNMAYGLRATVETHGNDFDWSNNSKTKEWRPHSRVSAPMVRELAYTFTNVMPRSLRVRWQIHARIPPGWRVGGLPPVNKAFRWAAGEQLRDSFHVAVPMNAAHGSSASIRIALVDAASNRVREEHEWRQVFDSVPPRLSNYRAILLRNHTVAVQLMADDAHAGVSPGSVFTFYSIDGGKTWHKQAHDARLNPLGHMTWWETVIGPFPPQTRLLLGVTATDDADNRDAWLPVDASVFLAPVNAELLLEGRDPVFAPAPSTLFEVEYVASLLARHFAPSARAQLRASPTEATRQSGLSILDSLQVAEERSFIRWLSERKFELPFTQIRVPRVPVRFDVFSDGCALEVIVQ